MKALQRLVVTDHWAAFLENELLSLRALIVPTNAKECFPTRPRSVSNMAEYDLALRYFTILPISVPTMVVGLIGE